MKELITAGVVREHHNNGSTSISIDSSNTIITPEARDVAKKYGIAFADGAMSGTFNQTNAKQAIKRAVEAKLTGHYESAAIDKAIAKVMGELNQPTPNCDRELASNGVVLVRGSSVSFGKFDGVPDHDIGLTDVISSADNSAIAAGYMQWEKCSFPWTLNYDEIDIVLEGELQIKCDGKTHTGKPGDVFFIPKGSSIEFGTPGKVRFVYVTYPADWTAAKAS